jgi:AraC-like DNA-binding protein
MKTPPPPFANLTPMRTATELRAVVESFAARFAAIRVSAGAEVAPLLKAFAQIQKAAREDNVKVFIEADRKLHIGIAQLAGIPGLVECCRTAAKNQKQFHDESIHRCWPDLNVLSEAHRSLVDAICEGNPSAAEDASRSHLGAIWYRLDEMTGDRSLSGDPLQRVRTYMLFHLDEPLRLDSLARLVARVSPGHLARLFRERHGTNFTETLREMRLRKAVELLVTTDQSIGRIARRVGYRDGSRFARHFATRFGLAPLAYRAALDTHQQPIQPPQPSTPSSSAHTVARN